eukprot:Tamp_20811.p3 GENE.Tamp_20811~~Tamp_20811.p3  ORF type:complete len:120 (+),score=17.09 Tamp_20811:656-1015(+)
MCPCVCVRARICVCARAPRVHRVSASASFRSLLTCRPPCSLLLPPLPCQLFAIVPIGGQRGNVLELAPWTWKGGRNVDPGVYNNVFDDLDTSPVTYHVTEPVDPTEYQNEYIGQVIGIY